MKSARNSLIPKYLFRIDGAFLVSKLCHQHEKKTLSSDGSDSGEFSRGGDHPGVTQAGTYLPQITTYATSFWYAGLALYILPNPGGGIPGDIAALYRSSTPLNLPLAFYVIAIVLLLWWYLSSIRYGKFLYAVGGKAEVAYETAVPVTWVQFSTYVISGLMAALSGIAITMLSGSGNADIGAPMTLNSITAVVIGGNALSGAWAAWLVL